MEQVVKEEEGLYQVMLIVEMVEQAEIPHLVVLLAEQVVAELLFYILMYKNIPVKV